MRCALFGLCWAVELRSEDEGYADPLIKDEFSIISSTKLRVMFWRYYDSGCSRWLFHKSRIEVPWKKIVLVF